MTPWPDLRAQLEGHVHTRTACPACGAHAISAPIEPHVEVPFALLPVCVAWPRERDLTIPFTICLCERCGLVLLRHVVDAEVLYTIFHSDGIGPLWDAHYARFAELIATHHRGGRLAEIGAGQGKLVTKLLARGIPEVEVIDPLYEGPRERVTVHPQTFGPELHLDGALDAIVSSHTLEHFTNFADYFAGARRLLREGGLLFTSVPNQEAGFARGFGNQLNFEHPSVCTNAHWLAMPGAWGFELVDVVFFEEHSVMTVARKTARAPSQLGLDARAIGAKLVERYTAAVSARIELIRHHAHPDRPNWVFGASNFTQSLLAYGLGDDVFRGVLDNSALKHGKRLYATNLMCHTPAEVVRADQPAVRVFLNVGYYNDEVERQLRALDPRVETIKL